MMIDQRSFVSVDDAVETDERDATTAPAVAAPSGVSAAGTIRTPFLHSDFITSDPIVNRDDLTKAQSHAAGAAALAAEHTAGLLYSSNGDAHQAPYGVVPALNSLDAHDWIRGNIWRDRTRR